MAENNHTGLIVAAVIIGGIIYMKSRNAALLPVIPVALPPSMPASMPVLVPTPQAAAQSIVSNNTGPNGIDPTVYATVLKWAQGVGKPPYLVFASAAVPGEYAGIYDLITNYWLKSIKPGPQQDDFWNNLRAKYDPSHIYW
jgi:hypothetical protein